MSAVPRTSCLPLKFQAMNLNRVVADLAPSGVTSCSTWKGGAETHLGTPIGTACTAVLVTQPRSTWLSGTKRAGTIWLLSSTGGGYTLLRASSRSYCQGCRVGSGIWADSYRVSVKGLPCERE